MEVAGIAMRLIKQWAAHAVYIDVIGIGAGPVLMLLIARGVRPGQRLNEVL